jgi:hypothetical protein
LDTFQKIDYKFWNARFFGIVFCSRRGDQTSLPLDEGYVVLIPTFDEKTRILSRQADFPLYEKSVYPPGGVRNTRIHGRGIPFEQER